MTTTPPRYEALDHTSEAGIIARGATLPEAFANAAEGMYSLVLDLSKVEEREAREIAVEADGFEAILVDWLLELVFLTDTEEMVFRRFEVDELSERRLHARAWGERFDAGRHSTHNVMVKAVTKHMLQISEDDGGHRVQVLFDI